MIFQPPQTESSYRVFREFKQILVISLTFAYLANNFSLTSQNPLREIKYYKRFKCVISANTFPLRFNFANLRSARILKVQVR